jgi:hypothetical protein
MVFSWGGILSMTILIIKIIALFVAILYTPMIIESMLIKMNPSYPEKMNIEDTTLHRVLWAISLTTFITLQWLV